MDLSQIIMIADAQMEADVFHHVKGITLEVTREEKKELYKSMQESIGGVAGQGIELVDTMIIRHHYLKITVLTKD